MKDSDTGEDINSYIKDHSEILKEIIELKEIEETITKFDISDLLIENEFIEIDNDLEEFQEIKPKIKPEPINKPKTVKTIKIRKPKFIKSKEKKKVQKTLNPTVFHLKINNDGKLENLDIKKPKIKDKKKNNFILKRFKDKKVKTTDKKVKKIKIPNFKNGILKIRKAIPFKSDKKEKSEKPKK